MACRSQVETFEPVYVVCSSYFGCCGIEDFTTPVPGGAKSDTPALLSQIQRRAHADSQTFWDEMVRLSANYDVSRLLIRWLSEKALSQEGLQRSIARSRLIGPWHLDHRGRFRRQFFCMPRGLWELGFLQRSDDLAFFGALAKLPLDLD